MRKGDWKLFYFYEDKSVELYDVKNDISEKKNLTTEQAKRTATMKEGIINLGQKHQGADPGQAQSQVRQNKRDGTDRQEAKKHLEILNAQMALGDPRKHPAGTSPAFPRPGENAVEYPCLSKNGRIARRYGCECED